MLEAPLGHGHKDGLHFLSGFREAILYMRGHYRVYFARYQFIVFQLAQLLYKHFFAYKGDGLFYLVVAQGAFSQGVEDEGFPAAANFIEREGNGAFAYGLYFVALVGAAGFNGGAHG